MHTEIGIKKTRKRKKDNKKRTEKIPKLIDNKAIISLTAFYFHFSFFFLVAFLNGKMTTFTLNVEHKKYTE